MAAPGAAIGFLVFEVILFSLASLTHGGRLLNGYEHARAAIAEAVLASVLVLGLLVSLIRPALARRAALLVQGFAILGVLVGVVMIVVHTGPRTLPDLALRGVMLATLVAGALLAWRRR